MSEHRLPTRAGWWIVDGEPVWIIDDPNKGLVYGGIPVASLKSWGWVAPLPSGAVLAALERYSAALAAFHDAKPGRFTESDRVFDEADAALQAAVRAELKAAS